MEGSKIDGLFYRMDMDGILEAANYVEACDISQHDLNISRDEFFRLVAAATSVRKFVDMMDKIREDNGIEYC